MCLATEVRPDSLLSRNFRKSRIGIDVSTGKKLWYVSARSDQGYVTPGSLPKLLSSVLFSALVSRERQYSPKLRGHVLADPAPPCGDQQPACTLPQMPNGIASTPRRSWGRGSIACQWAIPRLIQSLPPLTTRDMRLS